MGWFHTFLVELRRWEGGWRAVREPGTSTVQHGHGDSALEALIALAADVRQQAERDGRAAEEEANRCGQLAELMATCEEVPR